MDKKELKTIISNLKQAQVISLQFRNDLTHLDGEYEVVNTKKGKGKGGSMLAELRPTSGGDTIVVKTPESDNVLNVSVNGSKFGYETEEDVPLVIKPNAIMAATTKETLRSLAVGSSIKISSSLMSELNGSFTLVSVRPSKGRYGQIVATLKNSSGTNVEFWSYKHSGAVESFETA